MRFLKLLYILIFANVCLATAAQVKIFGKVVNAEGEPIEFATIRIGGTAIGANTGLDGKYSINVARNDTIELIVSCIGFKEHRQKLIKPTEQVNVDVRLFRTARELQELEVTEYKKQTDGMQSIDTEAIKKAPNLSGNGVESLITTMAGVSSKNELSSQYSVRGGSYDENSVYINGIEIYRPQLVSSGQQEGLSIINSSLVGSVDFSTGGFSAEYGDKMSSVLDITYRQPEAFEGNIGVSMMGADVAIGQNSGKFSQLHGIRYKRNTSILSSLETKGEYEPKYFDYQTNIRYQIGNRWEASFLGNISNTLATVSKHRSTHSA